MNSLLPFIIIAVLIVILAVFSFLFSASETSLIGLSKIRLRHMVAQGVKRAQRVYDLTLKLDKVIAAILIGNNFVNIAVSAIVTGIFVQIFGYNWGIALSTFATTLFILIFCEITPKILATKHAEKVALFTAPFMEAVIKVLEPVISVLIGISNVLFRLARVKLPKRSPLITEEELRMMIEIGKEEGVVSDEEKKMLHRIFEFGDTKVGEVMVPTEKMVAVSIDATPQELLDIFVEEGHARLPAYKGSRENIVGIVYAHDLLYLLRDKGLFLLEDLVHKAYCVGPEMRVNELLMRFQTDKVQIAIVIDKQEKALGLVTLEDLIEEIVGELEETHGKNSHTARR
jgi:putative hemolysin